MRSLVLASLPERMIVPCCKECNCFLGARLYPTLRERKQALKDSLRRHYKRILKMPEWKEEDLAELGYSLRSMIENNLKIKASVLIRLAY